MEGDVNICPCGTGRDYRDCCGQFHSGEALPDTAEQLMRSRYAAFALKMPDYLTESSHPTLISPEYLRSQADFMATHSWEALKIEKTARGGPNEQEGIVEFSARFLGPEGPGLHRERSFFVKEGGKWLFLRGEHPGESPSVKKVGRNDPCPCGSGKKYKKCHGR